MWQVGIGHLMALVKTFSCSEISLTISGTSIKVTNVFLYQKGDFELMRKDAFKFAKEDYFSGHSDTRSVLRPDYIFYSGFSR